MWSRNITKSNLLHILEETKGVGWMGRNALFNTQFTQRVQLKIQDVCSGAILTFHYYITTR